MIRRILPLLALLTTAATDWRPDPWLADLDQVRAAVEAKYANYDWLSHQRGVDIDQLFDRARADIRISGNDDEARAAFERLLRSFGDGHVAIRWPRTRTSRPAEVPRSATAMCRQLGYHGANDTPGIAAWLPGYAPLAHGPFPSGTIERSGRRVGILRIGAFDAHGTASLCETAIRELALDVTEPCGDACRNRIVTMVYAQMTALLRDRLATLRHSGASFLIVDIAGNGGGSEWAEVAARMVSPRRLVSARVGFRRGSHWAVLWRDLSARLRGFAATATGVDRTRLQGWAAQAESAAREAEGTCATAPCARVVYRGFSTGLIAQSKAGAMHGKAWAPYVFSIAQHDYGDSLWRGRLAVLVDRETWSAAEQFAAILQDHRAAIVIGARTGGAGCGYSWGGSPTTLTHSGATLMLPDCVRLRRDGSNEVEGITPDVPLALRRGDEPALIGNLLDQALDRIVRKRTPPRARPQISVSSKR